jgi:archaellum component FlaC
MVERFRTAYLSKNKMFNIFKRKQQIDSNLFDLTLKLEHQQKQMNELRELVLELSKQINSLQIEVNYLSNSKYGKSL